ncbi:MAG: hypothetical protein MPK75_13120, partial [Alphaproteobacteria bacterium]|nr:hypothetical protein [Alphaproteobacteria bacterium]
MDFFVLVAENRDGKSFLPNSTIRILPKLSLCQGKIRKIPHQKISNASSIFRGAMISIPFTG